MRFQSRLILTALLAGSLVACDAPGLSSDTEQLSDQGSVAGETRESRGDTARSMHDLLNAHHSEDPVVNKSEEEWRAQLTPEQYEITREHGTERPWGEAYENWKKEGTGVYSCVCCGAELFTSKEKLDARCGWPAFYDASKAENVKLIEDRSLGMVRTEVRCSKCDAHLGHVFTGEGFDTPTDQRYCINAVAMTFKPADG